MLVCSFRGTELAPLVVNLETQLSFPPDLLRNEPSFVVLQVFWIGIGAVCSLDSLTAGGASLLANDHPLLGSRFQTTKWRIPGDDDSFPAALFGLDAQYLGVLGGPPCGSAESVCVNLFEMKYPSKENADASLSLPVPLRHHGVPSPQLAGEYAAVARVSC